MPVRRIVPFLFLNVIISAAVVLGILFWWESRQPEAVPVVQVTLAAATPAGGAVETPAGDGSVAEESESDADGPVTYVVQSGDTLGTISQEFDVPLTDLLEVNDITNPDILSVGQELIIPVGGIPTATPRPAETETPAGIPEPIATEPLVQGEVDIQITGVIGPGQLTEEAVTITNLGSRQVGLAGWKVVTAAGREYLFGQRTLFGDGSAIVLHTETGDDTLTDVFWGLETPVWASGDTIFLLDPEGTQQATFVIP